MALWHTFAIVIIISHLERKSMKNYWFLTPQAPKITPVFCISCTNYTLNLKGVMSKVAK